MFGIEAAINYLREKYEEGKKLSFVSNPLTYALYETWKKYEYDTNSHIRNSGKKCDNEKFEF